MGFFGDVWMRIWLFLFVRVDGYPFFLFCLVVCGYIFLFVCLFCSVSMRISCFCLFGGVWVRICLFGDVWMRIWLFLIVL